MRVGIIDADLIGRKNHRFPNLASMKLSGFYKSHGHLVQLKTDYEGLEQFDRVFVSCAFTDTHVPFDVIAMDNVSIGGTGFFFDKAPPLPHCIEHHMPDYSLYADWITDKIKAGCKASQFKDYTDCSIGYLTRGCFRQCNFCVNKNCTKVQKASPLSEFHDLGRKKIILLDDNFLGYSDWKTSLLELQQTGKAFKFKQGLDERLLNHENCELLFKSKYDGSFTFAFDKIVDAPLIQQKLKLLRKYTDKIPQFYVLCGWDERKKYDSDFWTRDVLDTFERIKILLSYKCLPYIMRFNMYEESPYRSLYVNLARWCNQPSFVKKKSFLEFCEANGVSSACYTSASDLLIEHPEAFADYYNMKWGN